MNRHCVLTAEGSVLPYLPVDLPGGEHLPRVLQQQLQNIVLRGRQSYRIPIHGDGLLPVVHLDSAQGQHLRPECTAPQLEVPPQLAADPGSHLHRVEGLGDVVVRPHVEAQDLIRVLALGSQQDHRHVTHLPELCQSGNPVHLRHHNVQQHQMDVLPLQGIQSLLTRVGLQQMVVRIGQVDFQRVDDVLFIVADQDVIHGAPSLASMIPDGGLIKNRETS